MKYFCLLLLFISQTGFTQEIATTSSQSIYYSSTNSQKPSIVDSALYLYNYTYQRNDGTISRIIYDPAYVNLRKLNSNDIDTKKDKNGEIIYTKGVCTDVIVRSLRMAHNYDLQEKVHQDMKRNFHAYPTHIWNLKLPDKNIDHRRVPNLETFFKRSTDFIEVPQTQEVFTYTEVQPGDIVTYRLGGRIAHIGIVSAEKTRDGYNYKVIHHNTGEISHDDFLIPSQIKDIYRFKK